MKFYHGTTRENWKKIKEEGVLWGYKGENIDKDLVLEVEYDPVSDSSNNNYQEGCWQCRVYSPIPIGQVKLLSND